MRRPTSPLQGGSGVSSTATSGLFLALTLVLLQGTTSVYGYYDRRSRRATTSFSRRGYEGDGASSGFFAIGGWSMGSQNDITATTNVNYCSSSSDTLSLAEDEDPSSVTQSEEFPAPPEPSEDVPMTPTKKYTRKIGIFVRIRRPSKKVPSSQASSSDATSPEELASLSASTTLLDKETIHIGAGQPLIPEDVWNQMTGDEFDNPHVVDALAKSGLHMATNHDDNGWVSWKGSLPTNIDASLDNGDILVYTGSTLRPGFGSEVPWIKSISILPMTASEGAKLMMDSTRVKSYNSLSLGREDLKIMPPSITHNSNLQQESKIVRNVVQLPVSNSKVESVTLLHTRQLDNGSHLLVSRAMGGTKYASGGKVGRSFILLGVNLFEPVAGSSDECRMTAVTHVYSPGVPLMLAGKVGVKSSKNFVKDIRALCETVSQY